MDILVTALIGLGLTIVSAWMIRSHLAAWRAARADETIDRQERDYRRRQFRRRVQTSAMLGLLGIAMVVGQSLRPPVPGVVIVTYWAGVILLVLWIVLLAVADMISTRMFFGRIGHRDRIEQIRLRAELRRASQARNGDGRE